MTRSEIEPSSPGPLANTLANVGVDHMEIWSFWKNKMNFFKVVAVSILLYGYTTRMLAKRMKKKLDVNYKRIIWALLTKSRKLLSKRQQLYRHLLPISEAIKIRQTRHTNWEVTFFCGPLHMDMLVVTDQQKRIYISFVWSQDIVWKTCQQRWMIGTEGVKESGKTVRSSQVDVDDNDKPYKFYGILLCIKTKNSTFSKTFFFHFWQSK